MTELWTLGVEELVASLSQGELGVVEVVEAFIARARAVDPVVNCFVDLDGEAARWEAQLERERQRRGPLRGVPYGYKDVFARRGVMPTVGVRGVRPELRARDATVLERLRDAGAIALGSLTLDPFAYAVTGANPELGDTRNPWDPTRIAGGSSAGAAAAVAAGAVPFAIGTDAGGSIRIPAALCGVTGLKPTLGRIPTRGAATLTSSQDTVGILARSARDVAFVLEHVAGHDPADPASIPGPPVPFAALDGSCDGLRIGFDPDAFVRGTTPEVATAAGAALEVLLQLGAERVDVDLSSLEAYDAAATVLTWAEVGALHQRTFGAEPARYPPAIRARLELALAAHGADHANAMRLQGLALARLLEGPLAIADVLLCPTIADVAATADRAHGVEAAAISLAHLRLNRPFNFTGLPALAVPVGTGTAGMPLGIQLVGRPWAEPILLGCAVAYQAATDWHRRVPRVPSLGAA